MTKILLFIVLALTTMRLYAQTDTKPNNNVSVQSTKAVPYRLFPTQNVWTFIELNTRNGEMWQVQYSLSDSNHFVTVLSAIPLVTKEEEVNDRFTLYPTHNIWTFILLDQLDGRTWEVAWSADPEKRFVIPLHSIDVNVK